MFAVCGDVGSRGAAVRSALGGCVWGGGGKAAAACSKMHNSAFYLPLAELASVYLPTDESP